MSKRLLCFLISELAVVRVVCKKCKVTVELDVSKVKAKFEHGRCPCCREELVTQFETGQNALGKLADAIELIQQASVKVEVEFVLPDEGGE